MEKTQVDRMNNAAVHYEMIISAVCCRTFEPVGCTVDSPSMQVTMFTRWSEQHMNHHPVHQGPLHVRAFLGPEEMKT
jgi:hypothetical protein